MPYDPFAPEGDPNSYVPGFEPPPTPYKPPVVPPYNPYTDPNPFPTPGYTPFSPPEKYTPSSSFPIPNEFKQADPVAQRYSGQMGGNISGPANPYNNKQFVNTPPDPMAGLKATMNDWFGGIAKAAGITNLMTPQVKAGGMSVVGVQPSDLTPKAAPPPAAPPIDNRWDNPNNQPPVPVLGKAGIEERDTTRSIVDVSKALLTTEIDLDAKAPAVTNLARTNPAKMQQIVESLPDAQAVALSVSLYKAGASLPLAADGNIAMDANGDYQKGRDGKVIANPYMSDQKWASLTDPSLKKVMWDTFSVDNLQGQDYFDKLGYAYDHITQQTGLAIADGYYGTPQPYVTLTFSKGDIINGDLAGKLKQMGYNNAIVNVAVSQAKAIAYANEPPEMTKLRGEYSAFHEGTATGSFEMSIPSVQRSMPYDKALALGKAAYNIAQASVPGGVVDNLDIAGHNFERGQAIIELEKMRNGDVELVPEKNTRGEYTGRWTTQPRTFGFLEQKFGTAPQGSDSQMGGGSSVTQAQYEELQKAWKKSGSALPFEEWLAQNQGKQTTTTTSSSSSKKKLRLRSVSY